MVSNLWNVAAFYCKIYNSEVDLYFYHTNMTIVYLYFFSDKKIKFNVVVKLET